MKWRVLVTAPYMQMTIERFRPILAERGAETIVVPVQERCTEAELLSVIADIDGVICGDDAFTRRVLEAAPRLKVLSKWGTGIDSIDREACKHHRVIVCNTPNAFTEPVADTVIGYVLCFARKLPWMDRSMKDGAWEKLPSRSLLECTLGIIGVGNIGKAVAKRAQSFGMTVLGHDTATVDAGFLDTSRMQLVNRDELLARADFVSVNCDLNPTSRHLISSEAFALMKPSAVLINTARGPIVDEVALERALLSGQIAGAALDVFEREPLALNSVLRSLPQVMIAAHNSNSSPAAWEHVHRNTIENLFRVLEGSR